MECIVLAGGLGTRLQSVIGEYPKCMAEVDRQPFLSYLLSYLSQQGCTKLVLSLGFKNEVVLDWLKDQDYPFAIDYVVEKEALGTGGGINLALSKTVSDNVAVLNGDTFFDTPLQEMMTYHASNNAGVTIALKKMYDFDRYGVVNFQDNGRVISFEEKKPREEGYINGGVYIINKEYLEEKPMPEKFSFEQDFLAKYVQDGWIFAQPNDGYFIDIGIPQDFEKAQIDFKELFQ